MLGAGAFASVWLARDEELGSPVAIKLLADNWASRLDVRERFLTEARLLRQADSERVLRVLDIGELPDGRPYFVTDFADGGSLEDRLDGPMPADEALPILLDVAESVCVLHAMDVVHRDLKPSNVLFQGERVVLADLGLAKALAQSSGLTQMAGSPGYMAPEQSRQAGVVDERTDVYGLGALAHRLLTGTIVGDPDAPPIPKSLDGAIRKALQPDPAKRWPTMRALADELRGDLPRKRSKRVLVVSLCATLVLIGAGAVWWLVPRDAGTQTAAVASSAPSTTAEPTPAPTTTASSSQPPSSSSSSSSPAPPSSTKTPVDPKLCTAAEVKVTHNEAGAGLGNDIRWGAGLFFEAKTRACDVDGYLTDFRLVTTDGKVLPRKLGDGTGAPSRVTLTVGTGGAPGVTAEVSLNWSVENNTDGSAPPTPARAEFRLPGSSTWIRVPWGMGPVSDRIPVEVGPFGPAVN
ncbi:protein kinase [Amycolatopsis sp. NPDC059657]|uniref:protein kinase domain-containing protein n=1 Tax=Amycolatopsis sp. NPDC059657 TaxID=3346899 RepID=UPI0036719CC2